MMALSSSHLAILIALFAQQCVSAAFDGSSTMVVYWGQNSYGQGSGPYVQQTLGHYCASNTDVDVIPMAFLTQMTTGQGYPLVFNFANQLNNCTLFENTTLANCPSIGEDIKTCQQQYNKTILLSIGGAVYGEGGFASADAAVAAANLVWATFGPISAQSSKNDTTAASGMTDSTSITKKSTISASKTDTLSAASVETSTTSTDTSATNELTTMTCISPRSTDPASSIEILRPFGDAVIDGFDFDFESAPQRSMLQFAQRLQDLIIAASPRKYYLTAAPQCPYPDAADKDLLEGNIALDAVFVQFYNNYCGVNSFVNGALTQNNFNFATWDTWANKVSANPAVKIMLGVPAGPSAAGSGYVNATTLESIIRYSANFSSFSGMMMWDMSQAYANPGFLGNVTSVLRSVEAMR